MTSDAVLTEVVDEVLVVTLNRPEVRNAIDSDLALGVRAAFDELDHRDDLRVGVLTGAAGTFCSGMDLKAFARHGRPRGSQVLLREGARKPLVAAIEGFALGGGFELALVADILVMAEDALVGLPETRVGLFPSGGALHRLPAVLPRPVVAELAFTGDRMGAERAHHFGLVSRVTPPGKALPEALDIAAGIARSAPLGVGAVKELLRTGPGADDFWVRQRELAETVFNSGDAREGATAFAERRDPRWRNR
ncbi:MAG: hypothetical protein ABT15_05220 [Pseudonocardia sp. SCN 73-27]|uniref:crotonase/enoyl-CoA hydratase family protein n=1 Tax=unclassified Pseudonocardia TaxID=2619320 RepID=UPI00086A4975|nr:MULTISPECIES: crotonase/enoyl-CoA hydratase family protein [unclassified Pseudonocardia]ODU29971.1 MAG: hypothetical protein ABS80_01180 [Pseudonocardia sp. SCN 72-51]ODV08092.1 MAG: hypothetical protein ABT15_05220 [Pseudonocardia sp. SCN 73-27]